MSPHATYPFTGRFIVRLTERVVDDILNPPPHVVFSRENLQEIACALGLEELCDILTSYPGLMFSPVASSLSLSDLTDLEARATHSPFPPVHRLASYYVVDPRFRMPWTDAETVLARLRRLTARDGVDRVYRERELRDAAWVVDPSDDDYAGFQGYLKGGNSGPDRYTGINVQNDAVWGKFDGSGIGFVDLETGWNFTHEDIPAAALAHFNINTYSPTRPGLGDHGTAVLGIVVGVDNDKGVVGSRPRRSSVERFPEWPAQLTNGIW